MNESTTELKNLQEAIDFIVKRFDFSLEKDYPIIAKLSPDERFQFSVNHNFQHMIKSMGKIATHLENRDHGDVGDVVLLREAMVKELVNVLRLAGLLGVNAEELLKEIVQYTR